MEYKKIRTRKIYEEVTESLVEMIKRGDFHPGDKLDSVQQLAENFQVGRSAIREALSALRAMGLVEMRQGEGTYIKEFDPQLLTLPVNAAFLMKVDDVKNLLEVRKILEVGAAYTAARKRTDKDVESIEKILAEMEHIVGNEELGEKADFEFHMAIAKASKNTLLMSLMSNVSEMMVITMRETRRLWLYSEQTTWERLYQEHKLIFEAIKKQDGALAQQRMLDHLVEVENVLMKYLDIKEDR
ncbi:GntR family transcriptional regulator, transcriptional repressor for pyruvate dehydrogenase complex [Evansella caseinilytica]|uniref:GntR family transcriptional regulator, transcriptional repressor for pyruvate dehydrogenase complex n=1 Tax=Evansella caseinilytica TaxID=1503961 RepID=A0A1H3V0F0_9BACI|nr:FadR/GntR family transcriptional regulator [Evansella caseinilytica]SDZ67569.1 GntR family transcriptional regulator, transcriptional repressor for pyruvate dehydrogenase complex [Evansella caseinilytica]